MAEGSHYGGPLALDGDRPMIYITPNGTLSHAGHSIESDAGHSLYWSVGNSGIRYYHGGEAQVPLTFKGAYDANACSYRLEPLSSLWAHRNGPYGEGHIFASYGAFAGDNYRKNAANPAWAWRNKTRFGFGGSFLSDPAAVSGVPQSDISLIIHCTRMPCFRKGKQDLPDRRILLFFIDVNRQSDWRL